MGLDMYLYLKKTDYASCGKWHGDKGNCNYPEDIEELEEDIYNRNFKSKTTHTLYQVGYWRKANAIHNWFVENCADGVDECQEIYVSLENLKDLQSKVKFALKNKDKARDTLPTTEGFFFGSTEYDDWYFEDLKYTDLLLQKVIKVLENYKDYDCVYEASW